MNRWRQRGVSEMLGVRLIAFILSLLVATEVVAPEWEVAAILVVLGTLSMRDVYGLGFVDVETILLVQAPDASQTLLVVAPVLAGLGVLRGILPWIPRRAFDLRLLLFVVAVVMAAGDRIEPSWEVFAMLVVLGGIAIRDIYGLAFVVVESVLLFEAPDVSQTMLIIAAVVAGLSAFHLLLEGPRSLRPRPPGAWRAGGAAFHLRPGAIGRLRRWSDAGEA